MTSKRKDVRMKRKTADRLLDGLEKRIIEANANPNFFYKVRRAVVFGSYVNNPEMDTLGDLDVALSLVTRYPSGSPLCKLKRMEKMKEYRSSSYADAMIWPREEVLRFLRNRSPYISLHILEIDKDAVFSKDTMELKVG